MESDNSTLEEVFHFPFNQNTWALLPEIIHTPHRENQPLGTFKYRDKETETKKISLLVCGYLSGMIQINSFNIEMHLHKTQYITTWF
jgi:hypothetical protein